MGREPSGSVTSRPRRMEFGDAGLGLPPTIRACLFDLDGVLTDTAAIHAAAWKETFDVFLRDRAERTGKSLRPFDAGEDYVRYVDGMPRADGTRSFLGSRGITLPEGASDDPPRAETVQGLSNQKNHLVLLRLAAGNVEVFDGSIRYLAAVRAAGLRTAVVSSSANTADVLNAAGIAELFNARIDGVVALERNLAGKPAPDTFLAAAAELDATPQQAAVFEDAISGVVAGRAGGFGLVVGVDRTGRAAELRANGADLVVNDLAELLETT